MYKRFLKRPIDFLVALCGLILLSPIIGTIIAILYFVNQRKVFFFQDRPGKNGKIFRIVKFKTMNDQKVIFNSNADMIRHYFEKLLSDGNVHEMSDIQKYIISETKDKLTSNDEITPSMISSVIIKATNAPESRYKHINRGYYQKKEYNAGTIIDSMAKALINAKHDFDKSSVIDFIECNISENDFNRIQNAAIEIEGLLNKAVEVLNSTQAAVEENNDMEMTM